MPLDTTPTRPQIRRGNATPADLTLQPGVLALGYGQRQLHVGVPGAADPRGRFTFSDDTATQAIMASLYLPLAGGRLTGPLTLSADPTLATHAVTKQYVDNYYFPRAGGIITGPLVVQKDNYPSLGFRNTAGTAIGTVTMDTPNGSPTAAMVLQSGMGTTMWLLDTKVWVSFQGGPQYALLTQAGGTLVGALTLAADPSTPLQAATKQYVDAKAGNYLPLAGGTMTGPLVLAADPTTASQATTKQYADARQTAAQAYSDANFLRLSGGTLTGPLAVGGNLVVDEASIMAKKTGGNAFVGSWDLTSASNVGFWNSGNVLYFGNADGNGSVQGVRASFDGNGNLAANGSVSAGTALRAAYSQVNDFQLFRGAPFRYLQWSAGWYDAFGEADGMRYWEGPAGHLMQLDGSGNLFLLQTNGLISIKGNFFGANITVTTNAYKPGGGAWGDSSDLRTKQDIADYDAGLDAVCALRPVTYRHNGQGGTKDTGKTYHGLIAQEAREPMPELVFEMPQDWPDKLDGQLGIDATPLPYALVNAVRALRDRVVALEEVAAP
jgi:hypothetical protein